MSMVKRLVRRMGLDGNPLRRPLDRTQARIVLLLLVVFAIGSPAVAWMTGHAVYRHGLSAQSQQPHRFRTEAVVLRDAARPATNPAVGTGLRPPVLVPARWTAPDGTARSGDILVSAGTTAGTTIPSWTDAAGQLVTTPRDRGEIVERAVVLAAFAAAALVLALAGVETAVRRAFDRYRMAAWQAAWSRIEPQWSRRA